jgi:hypothetical protein
VRISSFKGCGIGESWNCGTEKDEIATSPNQKSVELLAMTDLEMLFTLILTFSHQGRRNF